MRKGILHIRGVGRRGAGRVPQNQGEQRAETARKRTAALAFLDLWEPARPWGWQQEEDAPATEMPGLSWALHLGNLPCKEGRYFRLSKASAQPQSPSQEAAAKMGLNVIPDESVKIHREYPQQMGLIIIYFNI